MRQFFVVFLLSLGAMAQTVSLPTTWVQSTEYVGTALYTITFPSVSTGGGWTCTANSTSYGPYTANSMTSANQAIADAETCRTATTTALPVLAQIVFPAGALFSATTGIVLPQTLTDASSAFIVLTSSTPLTTGRTVCSHGIQDNVASSTQPGIRNPGCNGASASYQLGTTITSVSGAFTLANGLATNTSAYNDIASMWTVQCTANNCVGISTGAADGSGISPHHYAVLNAEVKIQTGVTTPSSPIKIGTSTETSEAFLPNHIHIAYSYIHGDWADAPVSGGVATGGPVGKTNVPNGIAFQGCKTCSASYNYLDGMLRPGSEGHTIFLGLTKQIKVVHNWSEGQSIGLFLGGLSGTISIANFIPGTDIEDRANRYTYPYSWLLAQDAGFCANNNACSGNGYTRKNSHEAKVTERFLLDGNIMENVDNSGGQSGITMSFKVDNSSAGFGQNYGFLDENVTVTNNILRNACQGGSWGFRSVAASGNGGGITLPTQLAIWKNNLTYNIALTNPGCSGVSPEMGFRVNNNDASTWAATVARDAAGLTSTLTLTSASGQTQSNMSVGDPIYVSGCSDTTFNTSSTALTPTISGTVPTALTVIYSNVGTANATATGCTVSNVQGWPRYLTHTHNSDFINSANNSPYLPGNQVPRPLSRNLSFTNDLVVGGGMSSSFTEGTNTQTRMIDPSTEIFHDNLFAGRTMANYTEYSDLSVASSPPTTVYGPTGHCTTNDPTVGSCTGIVGAMSQGSFPTVLNDWHDYRLCHGEAGCNSKTSVYAAGQANQGSDGADLGFSVSPVDAAQTSTQYSCLTSCGSGPFADIVANTPTAPSKLIRVVQ